MWSWKRYVPKTRLKKRRSVEINYASFLLSYVKYSIIFSEIAKRNKKWKIEKGDYIDKYEEYYIKDGDIVEWLKEYGEESILKAEIQFQEEEKRKEEENER